MHSLNSIDTILDSLPGERKEAVSRLRKVILDNLPRGFTEAADGGMIHYQVPLKMYPAGYLDDPAKPLPFMSLASQKNHVALYHMGLYADPDLLAWFTSEYTKIAGKKPDMGKSCLRFKKVNEIPYDLIGKLTAKITPDEWISRYEKIRAKRM